MQVYHELQSQGAQGFTKNTEEDHCFVSISKLYPHGKQEGLWLFMVPHAPAQSPRRV